MDGSEPGALACVPGAICNSARAAHFALIKQLFREDLLGMTELERGFEFNFPPSAIASLGEFIANERRCCPFLEFELHVGSEPWGTSLRLTGKDGAKDVIRHELGLLEAA